MSDRMYRIGIDVGGTFTDAVVIDNQTYEIIDKQKTPTTHTSEEGVAKGIINIINELMEKHQISANQISFISHGTTQATNALLEGDVAKVGIIGMGEGNRAKSETSVEEIQLATNKFLQFYRVFISSKNVNRGSIHQAIEECLNEKCEVIVASESFSIEHPEHEQLVMSCAQEKGLFVTGGHEISELFGLRLRTRTAVINGSLIPKMMETANMTEQVVKKLGIKGNLMIMRADGGVMSIAEVRKRPILTMLSGLAAGIAGAIMYEKISDGIFFEMGGTSTDISIIKDGKVKISNASVGGHRTYLKSVDVQTLGIAGGTMIRENKGMIEVGPRSAHLANLPYECFDAPAQNVDYQVKKIQPMFRDPADYVVVKDVKGKSYALTLAGAANYLGYVRNEDYSHGTSDGYRQAWEAFGRSLNRDPKKVAIECMDIACNKIWDLASSMAKKHEIDMSFLTLYGGGGSAGVFTHYLGEMTLLKSKVVKNAPYISTIGVALAMITETIERSVINPTDEDVQKIRIDIIEKMVSIGALKETIETSIQVDSINHVLLASATGANEIRNKDFLAVEKTDEELIEIAKNSVNVQRGTGSLCIKNETTAFIRIVENVKKFGIFSNNILYVVAISLDGIVKFRRKGGNILYVNKADMADGLKRVLKEYSTYSDAGQTIPEIILFHKSRVFDYSGLMNQKQVETISSLDLNGVDGDEQIIFMVTKRG